MIRLLHHPNLAVFRRVSPGRWSVLFLILSLLAVQSSDARSARSADGSVAVIIPEEWMIVAPTEGAVLLLLTNRGENATVTILREPLGPGPMQTPIRYLFMKLDNFEKSFSIESQSTPTPLLIGGEEAARASFNSEIRQPDGSRINSGFVFTCLTEERSLYTVVGTSRADEFDAWRPVMDAVAESLRIGSP